MCSNNAPNGDGDARFDMRTGGRLRVIAAHCGQPAWNKADTIIQYVCYRIYLDALSFL